MDKTRTFVKMPGEAVKIDIAPSGTPWVINSAGNIFHWTGRNWIQTSGKGVDIGAGSDGTVFVLGTRKIPGGYEIYRRAGSKWELFPGAAVRIDADSAGNPWIINENDVIYRWKNRAWEQLPGLGTDLSVGSRSTWVTGTDNIPGGHGIYRWDERVHNWKRIPGGAVAISVGTPPSKRQ